MSDVVEQMAAHFAPSDLPSRVAATLERAGRTAPGSVRIDETAGLDQFHVEGPASTARLAEQVGVTAEDAVLDAGCGMGGPARYIAETYGATVRGIDMAQPYLETAEILNQATGLSDRVKLERGDVTDIRFGDEEFDVVWTQHAAQSVPDKAAFFSELFRVLKPGGRAVVHDLYRGPGDPIHFPAFWGQDDSISFLISDAEMRQLLEDVGFEVVSWTETTAGAIAANDAMEADNARNDPTQTDTIEGLDIFLLFGDQTLVMAENSVKDMRVGSVGIFEAILRKP